MLELKYRNYLPNRFTDGYGPNIQIPTCDRRRPYAWLLQTVDVAHEPPAMRWKNGL